MAGKQKVSLALSEADAALTILRSAIEDKLHPDDRKAIDGLLLRCRNALDRASSELASARDELQKQIDLI